MKFTQIEKLFRQGKYKEILDYALNNKKDDLDIWAAAMSMQAQLINIESLELAGVDISDVQQLKSKFIKSLIGFIQKFKNDTGESIVLHQNDFISLTKEKDFYKFTWFKMDSYDDYLSSFTICVAVVKNDSNGERLIKVLVDNRLLEQQELAKMFDFNLVKRVDRIIYLLNMNAEFVIFTVFNKKNIFAESFIEQVYKSGNIESRFFVDYDIAALKLEKYES